MRGQWKFDIKTVLLAMGWTVRGGYSTSAGMNHNDGSNVDVWPTWQDAVRVGSNDSWIIMRGPAALGFEVCFGENHFSAGESFFLVSQAGFFGASESGADGTGTGASTTPPTASDRVDWFPQESFTSMMPTTGITYAVFGMWSNDNKSHRLLVQNEQNIGFWLSCEHLDNPHPNLDDGGRIHSMRATESIVTSGSVMDNNYYTSTLYQGRVSGIARALYVGTSGYANLGHPSLNIVQQDDKMVVAPMDIYNNTLGEKGYYGTIPDMYYGNNSHFMQLLGDSVGGAPNWFSGGSIVSPWDGVTPERLPRNH